MLHHLGIHCIYKFGLNLGHNGSASHWRRLASKLAIGDQLSIQPHPWLSMEIIIIIIIIFILTITIINITSLELRIQQRSSSLLFQRVKMRKMVSTLTLCFGQFSLGKGGKGVYCLSNQNIPRGVKEVCEPLKGNFCRGRKMFGQG